MMSKSAAVVVTSTGKSIFFTLVSENTVRLQQNEQLKNRKQISYSEKIGYS